MKEYVLMTCRTRLAAYFPDVMLIKHSLGCEKGEECKIMMEIESEGFDPLGCAHL